MGLRSFAYAVAIVHFAYLAYVVFGGLLAWRLPKTIWLHLASCAWALSVTVTPLGCPLTAGENYLRGAAGQPLLDTQGFIVHYLDDTLHTERFSLLFQLAIVAVVALSWVGLYWRTHGVPNVDAIEPVETEGPTSPAS